MPKQVGRNPTGQVEPLALRERILAGILRNVERPPRGEAPCWRWKAKLVGSTPVINLGNRPTSALRWFFQMGTGEVVPSRGARVLRRCGNVRCVKPSHLILHRDGDPMPEAKRRRARRLTSEMVVVIRGAVAAGV